MLRVATGELQYTKKCDMICSTEVASKVIKRSLSRADGLKRTLTIEEKAV